MDNPFPDDTPELLMLDTRDVIDESVVNTVRTVEALGKDQYNNYRKSVINNRTHTIHDPIKNISLPLFRFPTRKTKNKIRTDRNVKGWRGTIPIVHSHATQNGHVRLLSA
jgi:hypothetical protein